MAPRVLTHPASIVGGHIVGDQLPQHQFL